MRKLILPLFSVLAIASLLLSACGSTASPASPSGPEAGAPEDSLSGTISISGAFALYPMMTVWAEEFTKIHPDVQFDVQGGGAF